MTTLSLSPSPREELRFLEQKLGSLKAVAALLGKSYRLVWGWARDEQQPNLQRASLETLDGAYQVVSAFSEHGLEGRRLQQLLETPWPELAGRSPQELLHGGDISDVLSITTGSPRIGVEEEAVMEGRNELALSNALLTEIANAMRGPVLSATVEADDDDDDVVEQVPVSSRRRSTAWKEGGTMSSSRWHS